MDLKNFINFFVIFALISCGICLNSSEPTNYTIPMPKITAELIDKLLELSKESS